MPKPNSVCDPPPISGLRGQVTCVVTLNDQHEYSGGGTWVEDLNTALAPPRGHAVLAASALRHAGHVIDAGERWVLVLFLINREMRYRRPQQPTPI